MTIKDIEINKDLKKTQSLINLFYHPVLVVNNDFDILASNNKLKDSKVLSSNLPIIMDAIMPLLNREQELAFCVIEGEEKLCTAMPMEHGRTLVKIARSKPSALAKRYYNLVTAIDQIPDAAIIFSEGKIDLVNEQFQKIFPFSTNKSLNGVPLDTILKDFSVYFAQRDKRLQALTYRFLRRKFSSKQELSLSFTSPDGQFYEYRDNLTFTDGRVGLIINESQIKGLNEQLESAFNEAHVLSNAKSNFMAAMSHEVRTPLNGIIGLLDLCEHQKDLKGNELLGRLSKSANSLLNLINDVLDFTKFDANMVQLSPSEINLRTLCEELIGHLYGQAKQQSVELTLFIDPIIPSLIKVDELRLMQVLTNLLSNGLKFNRTLNATLRLEVLKDELTNYIHFHVIDNGIGIEAAKIHTIFDRFTQANEEIHKTFGGTGLGLSICQKVVQLMGGHIYVESELGKGSTFVVQLPLEACSAPEIESVPAHLDNYTFVTNNATFFYDLKRYEQRLLFKTQLINTLPEQAQSNHIYLLDATKVHEFALLDSELSLQDNISNLPLGQTALLVDNINQYDPVNINQIHLVPLKLGELINLISSTSPPASSSVRHLQPDNISDRLRILVVEDNIDNIYVLKKQFDTLNIKAFFAMSAEEAIIFFEQQTFNVVISDYQMPVITGGELIGILRDIEESEQRPPAIMLILTADNSKQCQTLCNDVGVDRILMKPLTLQTLADLTRRLDSELEQKGQLATSTAITDEAGLHECIFDDDFFYDSSEVSSSIDPTSVFDISALIEMTGDISAVEEYDYLYSYQSNLTRDFPKMCRLAKAKDWKGLAKFAHKLKSSTRTVGAYRLSQKCEIVENAANSDSIDAPRVADWEAMKEGIEELLAHLRKYLENHDSLK